MWYAISFSAVFIKYETSLQGIIHIISSILSMGIIMYCSSCWNKKSVHIQIPHWKFGRYTTRFSFPGLCLRRNWIYVRWFSAGNAFILFSSDCIGGSTILLRVRVDPRGRGRCQYVILSNFLKNTHEIKNILVCRRGRGTPNPGSAASPTPQIGQWIGNCFGYLATLVIHYNSHQCVHLQ